MKHVPSSLCACESAISHVAAFIMLLLMICVTASCATTKPANLDLQAVLDDPHAYRNKYVELTGYVIDCEPDRGDTYRTLQFTLGLESDRKVPVSAAGYTAEAISKASTLVGEAFAAHEMLTVAGKLKVKADDESGGMELRLRVVEYSGTRVDVTRGRKTQPGFQFGGGWRIIPSIGIDATISP